MLNHLQQGKRSAFILTKVILNTDVFMSNDEANEYMRITTFDEILVQPTALVHYRTRQGDHYYDLGRQTPITKEIVKNLQCSKNYIKAFYLDQN